MQRIDIIAPALPPQLDGIGDYSYYIACELAKTARVRLLTVTDETHFPIPGVEIIPIFSVSNPASVAALRKPLRDNPPDWVFLQYNPFSYGQRGYNPYLPRLLKTVRHEHPGLRVAVMAHETYVPFDGLRNITMNLWQWPQFMALGKLADVLFLPVEAWVRHFARTFPRTEVRYLPVGSNLPVASLTNAEAKERLGLSPETLVLGLFGQAHISRQFDRVAEALRRVQKERPGSWLLYTGPGKKVVQEAVESVDRTLSVRAEGPFPPEEVSRRLQAVDIYLTPYIDGVSTRRGAFMAGIQHGLATVGTTGDHTDSVLERHTGTAFLLPSVRDAEAFYTGVLELVRDSEARNRLGKAARELYLQTFDWPVLGRQVYTELQRLTYSPRKRES